MSNGSWSLVTEAVWEAEIQNRDAETEAKDCWLGHRHHASLTGSISKSATEYLQAHLASSLEKENPFCPRLPGGWLASRETCRQGQYLGFKRGPPGRSPHVEDTTTVMTPLSLVTHKKDTATSIVHMVATKLTLIIRIEKCYLM